MENSSEVGPEVLDQKMAEPTNGTSNGSKEESESPEATPVLSAKEKVASEAPEETKESEESANGLDTPAEKLSSVSVNNPEEKEDPEDPESAKETPSCTVADLIEEEEEAGKVEEKSDPEEPAADTEMTVEEDKKVETPEEKPVEEEEKEEEKAEAMEDEKEETEPTVDEKKEAEPTEDEKEEDSKEDARSVKQDTKSAAELAYEWDDDGIEDEKPSPSKTPKKKVESKPKASPVVDVTPGRKSSRTPKPTQRKLESESQKNLKEPEEEEGDDEEDDNEAEEDEESVDAIAKELEKSDSDTKTSPGKKGSPKKGKKPVSEEKSKEEWVNLIFGENGEKVTEKGVKGTEKGGKTNDSKESKGEGEEGPDSEEFLPDDTPKAKKGGRPKKKGLDETLDGVAKLGSNMYFYTGPGGSDSPPPLDSDEEDLPIKKADSEPARKSSRANKGRNTRLERGDEVVDIPQVKEAPKPNLNPSWLKNHDSKNSPAKKGATPVVKPVVKTPAKPVEKEEKKKEEKKKEVKKEDKEEKIEEKVEEVEEEEDKVEDEKVDEAEVEKEEPMDTIEPDTETPKGQDSKKAAEERNATPPPDDTALEFDPEKFTPGYVPKTVKKGDDEYQIVVTGVKDTGLCGNYWNVSDGGRRRSRPPETLQMGKEKRRGSVGSVGSETSGKDSPAAKKGAATPASAKSTKKQVTKPEKAEEVEETKTPVGRGRKRKTEETPASKAKSAKKAVEDDTKEFSDYDSGNNETQPLRKRPKKEEGEGSQEASLTSKQQTAVAAALAAGVPGGQQRSVSCVADTNTQKEVVVECFAPYDDHRWVNIGKERDGMAPDAVQYARALRPPYHLLSFLRIKGHSTKGMSCTDKNTMVFVVLEGEITVILHTTQFNAKKGDSFYIPPKNYYNLINQKAREAELSLIQFQYDGPLPTVQPSNG